VNLKTEAHTGKMKEICLRKCQNIENPILFWFQMPCNPCFLLFVCSSSLADSHLDFDEGLEQGHQLLDQLDQKLH
jgi:hypothetical protein